ncbi:ABC transporter ATP-binding protein [Streptococcus caviae]|uniref:ABC transporter ATP-binding protein n=1 Tax=Streptococcus sp. 'caviae' TaxID=1915004 RepID=UPI00094B9CF4|nr:ABC transporter ATP-binding protein [Streptococcus sp. 'caviae']OLN84729.1 multidrug ABC transporter ATP-binding protein [Streptococcus sp. 'caviae']
MLKIENLSKQFKGNDFYSLQDVSLTVNRGDIVGLIGKNGAGKSTLLKLIAKSIKPSSGRIMYLGKDISQRSNALEDFGIMIDPVFYPEMTVADNLKFYLDLHGKKQHYENIETILKLVDLWKARHRKPKGFSFGMKQRTALAIALVAEPEFLLLDEPFVGLDPIGVRQLIDILKRWSKERNISMIISSHQLGELEALCNRYVFIENGHLAEEFEKQQAPSVIVHVRAAAKNLDLPAFIKVEDNLTIEIPTDLDAELLNQIWFLLSSKQVIERMTVKENHLSDFFGSEE